MFKAELFSPWDVFASGSSDAVEGCFILTRLTWVIKRLDKMYRRSENYNPASW